MSFDGAVIREQGVTFALVVVKSHVVQNRFEAGKAISAFQSHFPGMPVVLVGQDSRERRLTLVDQTSPDSWPVCP